MNFKNFTTTLAVTLVPLEWSADSIEMALQTKLPRRFARQAATMADALQLEFPKTYAPSVAAISRCLAELPEAHTIWAYAREHNVWPDTSPNLTPAVFAPATPFVDFDLPKLSNSQELADWLGITPEMLIRLADKKGLSNRTNNVFAPHYRFHIHTKPSGDLRLIEEPKPMLKKLQRRILTDLLNLIPPSPAAYGFTIGRDCLSAAAIHAGEEMVVCFDLQSFFPSVSHARIFGLFRTLGYPHAVAQDLTGLTTLASPSHVLTQHAFQQRNLLAHRHLPQGAPTSPALANLATFNLDRRLSGLARRFDAHYTRYADDMTFSGAASIVRPLLHILPQIVRAEGFTLNPSKTRAQHSARRQFTTGLVVNQKINIPRPAYDQLKATIHHLKNPDDPRRINPAFLVSLSGRITWVERVNPARGHKMRERLAAALTG
ncbi:MAG: reverse transcriptase family protein [Paracoccaceae bacterium]